MALCWKRAAAVKRLLLMVLWHWILLVHFGWLLALAMASDERPSFASSVHQPSSAPYWLVSEKGPFHRCSEYTEFKERFQQGFYTRYKIYREFSHWKVSNLAMENRDFFKVPLPLAPEFLRTLRLLGRRPSLQQINENLIKKYGTHFLLSATLGGEETLTIFLDKEKLSKKPEANGSLASLEILHQLAASYFTDRESTLKRLHHLQIDSSAIKVTETRTGPLGCSNYDSLDSVSSVLVHSPENRIHLKGVQDVLPAFLRPRFVEAALSYIACNSEGELVCHNNDCWCRCFTKHPECNCPYTDIKKMEDSLNQIKVSLAHFNTEFQESADFKAFFKKLPTDHFLNSSVILKLWKMDLALLRRYRQLEENTNVLQLKAQRLVKKIFALSKRCPTQPVISMPKERALPFWIKRVQSLLYCSEHGALGSFLEEVRACTCPPAHTRCQGMVPCSVAEDTFCASCALDNITRCGSCQTGYVLHLDTCHPGISGSLDQYITFDNNMSDEEATYFLQRLDSKMEVHALYISSDVRLGSWFNPAWRKRMLLTLKSNKNKSNLVHILQAVSFQICSTKNSSLEPVPVIYVNPFGGSHSESWLLRVNQPNFPYWEKTEVDASLPCHNWTLNLGNKWKSFFETVHIYLRSRILTDDPAVNETLFYEPLEPDNHSNNLGYMKINTLKVFGYSLQFDPDGIKDLILQLDYKHSQGTHDSLFTLMEMRDRINWLMPSALQRLDLFACLLRHRLRLSANEVIRIRDTLRMFSTKLRSSSEDELSQLCS